MRRAFAAAAVVWAAMLPAASYVSAHGGGVASRLFAAAIYAFGGVICHQLPQRSFALWAAQLPVCARCTGIYVGAAVAALPMVRLKADPTIVVGSAFSRTFIRRLLVIAVLPTIATLAFEWTTGETPSNMVRAFAGVPLGVAVAWIVGKVN